MMVNISPLILKKKNDVGFYQVPNQKIVQRWRVKSWPAAHFSTVTFQFDEKDDCTVLNYTQTGVPDSEYEKTKEGWVINYWNRMKQVLGFGSSIF